MHHWSVLICGLEFFFFKLDMQECFMCTILDPRADKRLQHYLCWSRALLLLSLVRATSYLKTFVHLSCIPRRQTLYKAKIPVLWIAESTFKVKSVQLLLSWCSEVFCTGLENSFVIQNSKHQGTFFTTKTEDSLCVEEYNMIIEIFQ